MSSTRRNGKRTNVKAHRPSELVPDEHDYTDDDYAHDEHDYTDDDSRDDAHDEHDYTDDDRRDGWHSFPRC